MFVSHPVATRRGDLGFLLPRDPLGQGGGAEPSGAPLLVVPNRARDVQVRPLRVLVVAVQSAFEKANIETRISLFVRLVSINLG
jgi:hypothetical protein